MSLKRHLVGKIFYNYIIPTLYNLGAILLSIFWAFLIRYFYTLHGQASFLKPYVLLFATGIWLLLAAHYLFGRIVKMRQPVSIWLIFGHIRAKEFYCPAYGLLFFGLAAENFLSGYLNYNDAVMMAVVIAFVPFVFFSLIYFRDVFTVEAFLFRNGRLMFVFVALSVLALAAIDLTPIILLYENFISPTLFEAVLSSNFYLAFAAAAFLLTAIHNFLLFSKKASPNNSEPSVLMDLYFEEP